MTLLPLLQPVAAAVLGEASLWQRGGGVADRREMMSTFDLSVNDLTQVLTTATDFLATQRRMMGITLLLAAAERRCSSRRGS